jgi:DNA-binding NarL/FixJ family response regulator
VPGRLAVLLTAAATALRQAAGLPAPPASQTRPYLDAARSLAPETLTALWDEGSGLTPDAAVTLALESGPPAAVPGTGRPGDSPPAGPARSRGVAARSSLTPREREITALIARGYSNKGIADELVISPATAARHVANILSKLGFTSRAQIAAWAAGNGSIQLSAAHQQGSLIP